MKRKFEISVSLITFILICSFPKATYGDCPICTRKCGFLEYSQNYLQRNFKADEDILKHHPETILFLFLLRHLQNNKHLASFDDFLTTRLCKLLNNDLQPFIYSGQRYTLDIRPPSETHTALHCQEPRSSSSNAMFSPPVLTNAFQSPHQHNTAPVSLPSPRTNFQHHIPTAPKTLPAEKKLSALLFSMPHESMLKTTKNFASSPLILLSCRPDTYSSCSHSFLLSRDTWSQVTLAIMDHISPRFLSISAFIALQLWRNKHHYPESIDLLILSDPYRQKLGVPAQDPWFMCHKLDVLISRLLSPRRYMESRPKGTYDQVWEISPEYNQRLSLMLDMINLLYKCDPALTFQKLFDYAYQLAIHLEFILRMDFTSSNRYASLGGAADFAVAATIYSLHELLYNEGMVDPRIKFSAQ